MRVLTLSSSTVLLNVNVTRVAILIDVTRNGTGFKIVAWHFNSMSKNKSSVIYVDYGTEKYKIIRTGLVRSTTKDARKYILCKSIVLNTFQRAVWAASKYE